MKELNWDEIEKEYTIDVEKGTVFSKKSNRHIGTKDKDGYVILSLYMNGERFFDGKMHRLIYMYANKQEIPKGYEVDHSNCIRDDNRIENLRLCTKKENQNNPLTLQHMSEARKGKYIGENHPMAKAIAKIDKNSGEILEIQPFMRKFEELYKFNSGNISKCCQRKRLSAYGFKWSYVSDL